MKKNENVSEFGDYVFETDEGTILRVDGIEKFFPDVFGVQPNEEAINLFGKSDYHLAKYKGELRQYGSWECPYCGATNSNRNRDCGTCGGN